MPEMLDTELARFTAMKRFLALAVLSLFCLVAVIPVSAVTNWTFDTAGTHYWVCPAGVTSIVLEMYGGGGSGSGAPNANRGLGGNASDPYYATGITVVPGTNYTLVVGDGGLGKAGYPSPAPYSNPGSPSYAFSRTSHFGLGGLSSPTLHSDGGAGENSTVGYGTGNAEAGGNSVNHTGGAAGAYPGSGGGGGAVDYEEVSYGAGGRGSAGMIKIYESGSPGIPVNQPDFEASITTGYAGTLITFVDKSIITDSSNLTYSWNFGDFTNASTIGNVSHVYSYMGSFTVSLTIGYGVNENVTTSKESYITITNTPNPTYYIPNQVRFTVLDYLGNNVPNAVVNANYDQTTLPDAITWLTTMYGVDPAVAAQMLSSSLVMTGLTGSDGAITFTMHPSLRYNVTAINGTASVSSMIYPKEADYNIWLPAPAVENLYEQINATLTFSEPNASYFTMGARFQDHSDKTSLLYFYVNRSNGTPVYSTSVDPGTALTLKNYTIQNVRGQAFYWGIRATRTGGNLSLDQGVTGKGPSGMLVDLRLPDAMYYPWLSLFILFMVTSLASKNNIRFMAILMPALSAMFWWFGWLSGTYLTSVIPFACLLGATYYMKGSLRENYGTGGPGALLLNIVAFVIILQMMIGFINGLGVFSQTAVIQPQNKFSNVDLTSIKNEVSNFGGINDPLQSANSFASIGWATIKIAFNMIGAVFVVGIYLAEMFPYFPVEFFAILQGGIYILYIFFILKLVGKSGTESDF